MDGGARGTKNPERETLYNIYIYIYAHKYNVVELFTIWCTLKSTNIDKNHKIHALKLKGVFFLNRPKRRRQLPPAAQCWGTLKLTRIDTHRQHPQNTCPKIPGRAFSETAEAPQAITTSRTVLGDPETGKAFP